jgi:lipoprotein-anchoring transpeptidase ErfK/SrfK
MENTFFIPIQSNCLAHYFSKAIILPSNLFENRPEDIQSKFHDSILLSKSKWVKNTDCSIEIILTQPEIKELFKLTENFYQYNRPIPISRVKQIHFLSGEQKEVTIWNINDGAAFIPEKLIAVEQNDNINYVSDEGLKKNFVKEIDNSIEKKIKQFDTILGGFAFMKLGGKSFMNYSENYFSTLSHFNKLIEEQTNNATKEKGLKLNSKFISLFSTTNSEWSKWQKYIHQNVETQDIENLAEIEGIKIEKKFGLIKLDSIIISSHLYDIAVLAIYGENKNKTTDDLVTDLSNEAIPHEKSESVCLLFGLNNGYSRFRNKYKTANQERIVKFKLESKLDYYTIESIYQFVFNANKSNSKFNFIDELFISQVQIKSEKDYDTYKILDTVVIAKKKQTPLEFFLENYSTDIYETLVKSLSQWLPPFAKIEGKEGVQYFEKVLKNTLSNSVEAIQRKIERDNEENFNTKEIELSNSHIMEIKKLKIEIANLNEENKNLRNAE